MENWLLLAVGIVFLVCMIAGFVKGFLRIGLSLLSTILTLVLVSFLSPYVSDALMKHTPAQDVLEKKIVEAFMPEISADDLLKANLTKFLRLKQSLLINLVWMLPVEQSVSERSHPSLLLLQSRMHIADLTEKDATAFLFLTHHTKGRNNHGN